jgi:transcriptional regulator with XRE-family HTH domain
MQYDDMPDGYAMTTADIREILATNLRALMDSSEHLKSTPAIERATEKLGCKVGKSTVDRALKSETPLNIDYLQAIARVFGVDAWQLLVVSMNPKNPPVLKSVGKAEDALYQRIGALVKEAAEMESVKPQED